MSEFFLFSLLAVAAALMSYINTKFLKLPKAVGLTILSITFTALCAFFLSSTNLLVVALSSFDFKKAVLDGMLSFLLFASALHFNILDLKREIKAIFGLASIGLILSTFITATLLYGFCSLVNFNISYGYCLVFGALISPTDPIAVISTLSGNKNVPLNLKTRVVGESLFNDATGIVLFVVLSNIIFFGSGGDFGNLSHNNYAWMITKHILIEAGGGIVLGYIFAECAAMFLKTNKDPETSIFVTLGVASMGYVIASSLHVSGPIAMVVAGLFIGHDLSDIKKSSPEQVEKIDNFWTVVDNILNSFLFILIGLEVTSIPFNHAAFWIGSAGLVIIIFSRFISSMLPITIIDKKLTKSSAQDNILLAWSGIRGGISLALALSLPNSANVIVSITYVVVILSIIVQGPTLSILINTFYPAKTNKIAANDEIEIKKLRN